MTYMSLSIPGRSSDKVKSYAEASRNYCLVRDTYGEGASTFPDGIILDGSVQVARVSYNGRVWDGSKFDNLVYQPEGGA